VCRADTIQQYLKYFLKHISAKKISEEVYIGKDPDPDAFKSWIRIWSKIVRIRNTALHLTQSKNGFCGYSAYFEPHSPLLYSIIFNCIVSLIFIAFWFCVIGSVVEPHHFYAAPAPGKNFDAAPAAPAPTGTLLLNRSKTLKGGKGNIRSDILFSCDSLLRKL
jgi:hypothetical protein